MSQKTVSLINPFQIKIDPMERLLLINFEKDPDSVYIGFEPQVFNDPVNGSGHLVIGWRTDGRVDVYHQPGLKPDPRVYDNVGKGLANISEVEFSEASYEFDGFGVQAYYRFKDIDDRDITLQIKESNPKRRKPFGLLAPMGDAAVNPSGMPLVLLHDFYFVRKKHTETEISIAGKKHKPDELPMPLDGVRLLYSRYSPKPLIVTLNPAADAELVPLEVNLQQNLVTQGEYDFELEWNNDHPAIKSIVRNNAVYPVTLRFLEAFPDVRSLDENVMLKGRFGIGGHPSTGLVTGHYTTKKKDGVTRILLVPSGGWKPRYSKLSLLFLYTVAKIFKAWPTTYEWTATIRENETGNPYVQSKWRRIR